MASRRKICSSRLNVIFHRTTKNLEFGRTKDLQCFESSDVTIWWEGVNISHFHNKLDTLLSKIDAPEINVNVFQIEASFLQVKLHALEGGWKIFDFFRSLRN